MRAAVLILVVGCHQHSPSTGGEPAPRNTPKDSTYDDWTLRDLMNHLEKKGLKFRWFAGRGRSVMMQFPDSDGTFAEQTGWEELRKYIPIGVDAFKYDSEKKAREAAGSTKHGQHWKVFAFYGRPDDIKKVMALLPK